MANRKTTERMDDYEKKLAQMVEAMAEQIAAGARARVYRNLKEPHANSPLAQSIRVEKNGDGIVRVVVDRPYARYVEFGTRYQPPRPFLTPAVEEVRVRFAGLAEDFMK